jgi:3-deoxy-D-manno-octulosonic-acid transferase
MSTMPVGLPAGLRLYRAATTVLGPLAGAALAWRARAGKEDAARLPERFGHASAARPRGALVWLHGASVGETRVLMLLRNALAARRSDLSFLFTSGTRTSASLLASPPPRALHQFAPIDRIPVARRFVQHWRPNLAVFAESDLWPNLIEEAAAAGVKLALVNARMSGKSLDSWRRSPATAAYLMKRFDTILAADMRTADGIGALVGRAIAAPGNLKAAAPAPKVDAAALAEARAACASRRIWLAASTHPGEEEIVLAAHDILRQAHPDALLVIAPRHPERGPDIATLARGAPRRSAGARIGCEPVHIADTMGELGLFYALAPVSLVAGSLLPGLRGHNPVEPAQLGSAVVAGPHTDSFADIYADLGEAGAVSNVRDAHTLAAAVEALWRNEAQRTRQTDSARAVLARSGGALEVTVAALEALLPQAAHAAA